MSIQRNRRIAVAGGILAAAAVIVPVAVFAGNGLGDSKDTLDPVTTPTVTQATDPNDPTPSQPAVGILGISYLEGTTWHRADGSTTELDERYDGGTVVGDELLAVRNSNERLTIDVVTADGEVTESIDTWSYPVADAEHRIAAYIEPGGSVAFRAGDSGAGMSAGLVEGDSIVAVNAGDDCAAGGVLCEVFVSHGDGSPPEVLQSEGIRYDAVPGAYKLNDVAEDGRRAAQLTSTTSGSCSGVVAPSGATDVETCDFSFDDFSPDGTHLSGADAYRDGFGQGYVVILDAATGDQVARWEGNDGIATTWVWEDAEHLLITAYEPPGKWRIYRLGVDGSTKQVLAGAGDDVTPAFTLLGGS